MAARGACGAERHAAHRRADGLSRERLRSTGLGRSISGGTPEARVDGGPQHTDRHSLGVGRRGGDATVRAGAGLGFVASFARPGGNVTGFVTIEGSLGGKWLELLKEIAPRVARVALPFNPATATFAEYYLNPVKAAAASLGVEAIVAPVHDRSELESVIAAQAREPNSGLVVIPDAFMINHRAEITLLAARHPLPAVD